MTDLLQKMVETQKIPHALLLTGEEGEKRGYEFAFDVICLDGPHHRKKLTSQNHPDFHVLKPEGKLGLHPIHSLNHMKSEAYMKAFEGKWRVFLIHDAEKMAPISGNALLKILEEPPSFTLFLLLSREPEKILPTIRSRCQIVEFTSTSSKIFTDLLDFLAKKMSKQEFVSKYQEHIYSEPALQRQFFETILLWYRDRICLEIENGKKYLSFPDRIEQLKLVPLVPIEKVEKRLQEIRLGLERSVKFSLCLEILEAPFASSYSF